MDEILGRVVAVSGSQMRAAVTADQFAENSIRIGAMIKVESAGLAVVGTISAAEFESRGSEERIVLVADLLGEIVPSPQAAAQFVRGVSRHPIPGAAVRAATAADLTTVYTRPLISNISIGTLYHDARRPAFVLIDELLAKNFAVLGAAGSGKSCAITVMLSAILADHSNAHIIVLDPHNEYASAFAGHAELFTVDNLQLPLWVLDFEEAVGALVRGGTVQEQETQAIILKDAITRARRRHWSDATTPITVDTPVPFGAADLLRFIDEAMGRFDNPDTSAPYLRLRTRLESLRSDRRYAFLFSDSVAIRDTLPAILGRLLRIPVNAKPVTIIDLSGIPSEITDVVVSLVCRLIFDVALWSDRQRLPPVLLVCEEAHRYVPAAEPIGFGATARAITRIAREGRKYGVSLALISQLPSELSGEVLSQCGTIFAMRMGHDLDQRLIGTAMPDAARGMLAALPSMRTQETIVFGEGVPLPMRIRFDDLPPERRPRSDSAKFSTAWQSSAGGAEVLDEAIRCWRSQSRKSVAR
jgi:DNA helicase HerA-like ATPase